MVITLDMNKHPLGVCTERRARILLTKKRACVHRYYPFTIIVKDADVRKLSKRDEYKVKIDPGAKTTGIAVVRTTDNAVMFYQLRESTPPHPRFIVCRVRRAFMKIRFELFSKYDIIEANY